MPTTAEETEESVSVETRFGKQRAYYILRERKIKVVDAARLVECRTGHLAKALHGRARPAPEVITGLSRMLRVKPKELFDEEMFRRYKKGPLPKS